MTDRSVGAGADPSSLELQPLEETDQMKDYASAHKKRRRSKKKTTRKSSEDSKNGGGVVKRPMPSVDKILANVFEEVLAARDRGERVTEGDVQQKAYEQTHEAVMGRKAFSKDDRWRQSLPREPLDNLRRLRRCTLRHVTDVSSATRGRFVPPVNYRGGSDAADTAENNNGFLLLENTVPVFLDAVDELAYWEGLLYSFLRDHPARLRKSLPLLMEQYTVLAHRLKDAMLQYIMTRNEVRKSSSGKNAPSQVSDSNSSTKTVSKTFLSQEHYTLSENYLRFPRDTIVETGKSLSGTYDPTKFMKSATGRLLKLDSAGYQEWRQQRRAQQRELTEAFSSLINS